MSEEFGMLADYDEEDNPIHHAIVGALKDGGVIESVEIGDEWSDDHCPCLNVTAVVNGETFNYSDWWLSSTGVRMYYRSECDGDKGNRARNQLKKHILEMATSFG